ncbi:MAG: glycosyltransferase [Deltaproteobacteria bacterium]|nr:glycosyltransferase [Deltaproteobacteria bacterium]
MGVSIITPSFNNPRYVLDTLRSVIGQSYQDWTLFLLDNSTDEHTRPILRDFLKSSGEQRIKYLEVNFTDSFRENIHISSSLCNAAFLLADQEYLLFLAHDDLLDQYCLESMATYLTERSDISACYCRGQRVGKDNAGNWQKIAEFPFGLIYGEKNKPDCQIDGGQVLFRKSLVEQMIIAQETINLCLIPKIQGASHHTDGIFLNKLTRYTDIPPCPYHADAFLLTHRCIDLAHNDLPQKHKRFGINL